jgi:hypothetical protein
VILTFEDEDGRMRYDAGVDQRRDVQQKIESTEPRKLARRHDHIATMSHIVRTG